MELMRKTKYSPNDQLLYLNDRELENELTLEAECIATNSQENPMILILQQGMDIDDMDANGDRESKSNADKPRQQEKGFRDTALA